MSIATEINRPSSTVFRRAQIRRRQTSDGLYESTWTAITPFVKDWGHVDTSLDEPRLNRFTQAGITLRVRNNTGAFNPESISSSLWSGFMTRYRTLVRVQAGYEDTNGTDLPPDPTQGIFVLDKPIPIAGDANDVLLQCASLRSVFEEVRVRDVAGMGATASAGAMVLAIRNHSDGAGVNVFQQFITSTAWTIDSNSSNNYNPATTTSLEAKTVADFLDLLAEAEGKVWFIDRTGSFQFVARPFVTGTSLFTFEGQGFARQNMIKLLDYYEDWDNLYTYVRLKYLEPLTSTSYVTSGTTTAVNPTNTSWRYGQRVYTFDNDFISGTTTAQAIADNFFSLTSVVRNKVRFVAKMAPQLEIHDPISVSYHSYDMATQILWDTVDWNGFNWSTEGQNFDWTNRTFRVTSKRLDLDTFAMEFTAREV